MSQSLRSVLAPAPERALLAATIGRAAANAAAALSEMSGRPLEARSTRLRAVQLSQLSEVAGDPEQPVIGIYLGVNGSDDGHMLLALGESTAFDLVDLLLGQPEGSTRVLGDLEVSALAEAGNVAGSFFLSGLADHAHLVLPPTPPAVFHEMRGAVLDTLAAELAVLDADEALVIDTQFASAGQTADLAFYMFPTPAMLRAVADGVLEAAGHARV